jgi:uncharacterized DUF497 family protein
MKLKFKWDNAKEQANLGAHRRELRVSEDGI